MFEPRGPQDRLIEELWLSRVAWMIWKAGGFIRVAELRGMSLQNFAMICGRNGLGVYPYDKVPIITEESLQELLEHGLEGGPEGEKE